jgi:hypothetical protein
LTKPLVLHRQPIGAFSRASSIVPSIPQSIREDPKIVLLFIVRAFRFLAPSNEVPVLLLKGLDLTYVRGYDFVGVVSGKSGLVLAGIKRFRQGLDIQLVSTVHSPKIFVLVLGLFELD